MYIVGGRLRVMSNGTHELVLNMTSTCSVPFRYNYSGSYTLDGASIDFTTEWTAGEPLHFPGVARGDRVEIELPFVNLPPEPPTVISTEFTKVCGGDGCVP